MEQYEAMLKAMKRIRSHTLMGTLEINYTDFDGTYLSASMPVTPRVHQPMGLLHGGATVALGETLGSSLSSLFVDMDKYRVMGMEIAANHLHQVRSGYVFGKAFFVHKGRVTHLVEIAVRDEAQRLVSQIKMTNIILPVEN